MNTQDVITLAQQAKLRLIRFQYCDNGGIIRAKATHISGLPTVV
jgi:glutamine synthetase